MLFSSTTQAPRKGSPVLAGRFRSVSRPQSGAHRDEKRRPPIGCARRLPVRLYIPGRGLCSRLEHGCGRAPGGPLFQLCGRSASDSDGARRGRNTQPRAAIWHMGCRGARSHRVWGCPRRRRGRAPSEPRCELGRWRPAHGAPRGGLQAAAHGDFGALEAAAAEDCGAANIETAAAPPARAFDSFLSERRAADSADARRSISATVRPLTSGLTGRIGRPHGSGDRSPP